MEKRKKVVVKKIVFKYQDIEDDFINNTILRNKILIKY